jgi:hypothetical protein
MHSLILYEYYSQIQSGWTPDNDSGISPQVIENNVSNLSGCHDLFIIKLLNKDFQFENVCMLATCA